MGHAIRGILGRRVTRTVNGETTHRWVYKDALNPVAELDSEGNVATMYIYGANPFTPQAMIRDGVTYRIVSDMTGSVRLVVNAETGDVVQRIDYDSFGRVIRDTNPGFQPFGFQGGLHDPATGLVRFGAREYDPQTARWLSKDPIRHNGSLNLYVFAGNDPVNAIDPWGMCEQKSPSQWRLFWDSVYQDLSGQDPTFATYGLRESAQWTADRRATAIDYYSDAMAENLSGTFYLGGAARAVVVSGPDVAAGLRFNLTADHMLSPYLSMGGGSGYEIAGGVEGGYIPGDVSRFNGNSINVSISGQVGGTLVVPVDPLSGESYKVGGSFSYGSGSGGSVTYTRTFSWK